MERVKSHGMKGTKTYASWHDMKQRCLNPNNPAFDRYGGRGIAVSERWLTFENFLADMGAKPKGYELDRIDNDGPYTKNNCRWTTPKNNANNRRNSKKSSVLVSLTLEELEKYLEYLRGEE